MSSIVFGKAPKEIHAILTEILGENAPSYGTVSNWVALFERGVEVIILAKLPDTILVHIHTHKKDVHKYIYIYTSIYGCVCVFFMVSIYIYIYTHIYTHTHTQSIK